PLDHAAVALVVDELAAVGEHRLALARGEAGRVHHEGRLRHRAQVRGPVLEQPLRVPRLAGDDALGELRVEARVLDDPRAGDVVGVRVLRVRHEQHLRAEGAD
ncbi:MAG: hypothetical protein ACK56I_09275, partial [bacterium]